MEPGRVASSLFVFSRTKPSGWHAAFALGLVLATACLGCGAPDKPNAGLEPAKGVHIDRLVDPTDLFPSDLDLVIRVDVARMRSGIGPAAADTLAKRAFADGGEPEVREALACADVVWIATRLTDLDAGDRVIAVEGKACMPDLASTRWQRKRSVNKRVRIFDRTSEAPRSGTARIVNLNDRATVFVSPVELDAVTRVMDIGPDSARGNPAAEGLLSFDQRAGRLAPGLASKYPAINEILAGIERLRGTAVLVGDGLKLDVQVVGTTPEGATRAARFFEAMRDSLAKSARFGAAMKDAKVDLSDKTVQLHVTVPAKALLSASESPEERPDGGT